MQKRIDKFFKSNKLAFIFSLIVSFCIWVKLSTSSSEKISKTISNIPINITLSESAKESGLRVFGLDNVFAEVTVEGNRIALGQLTKENITVFAQQSAGIINTTGNYTLELLARKNGRPLDYEISGQVSPRFINVFVDRFQEKTFDITPNINCSTDANYFIGVAALSESSVKISGPETVVSNIASVCVEKDIKEKITQTVNLRDLPLTLYDENGKRIASTNLTFSVSKVDVTLSVLSKKTVKIEPVFLNKPDNLILSSKRVEMDQTKLEIAASKEILDSIDFVPLETLDFSNINLYKKEFNLPIKLPSGVKNLSNIYSVNLKINTDGMQSKTVKVNNINFLNVPQEKKVNSFTKILHAEIVGPSNEIKNIKTDDLIAEVDLSTKENFKGIIELPAEIKFTSGSSCWVYGKYNVTVQVE